MANKIKATINERIREYYCSEGDNNEWLVEKGKIKEGRLLKEACLEVERLQDSYSAMSATYHELYYKDILDKDKIIKPYKEKVYKLERKIKILSEYMDSIEFKYKDTANLIKSIRAEIKKK